MLVLSLLKKKYFLVLIKLSKNPRTRPRNVETAYTLFEKSGRPRVLVASELQEPVRQNVETG